MPEDGKKADISGVCLYGTTCTGFLNITPNFFIKGMLRIYLNVPYALHFAASRSGRADKRKAQGTVSVPYCLLPIAYCLCF